MTTRMPGHAVTMLGSGLIADFYTMTLHGQRSRDHVDVVYSRSQERGETFAERWNIGEHTTSLQEAIEHPATDTVVVALPNFLHEEAIAMIAEAGKSVLCTKPLGRDAAEAKRILDKVEAAGIFAGYLEDLCYTPKSLKAVAAVQSGAIGDVTWVRSREKVPWWCGIPRSCRASAKRWELLESIGTTLGIETLKIEHGNHPRDDG